ncbi:MAG: hypothetical protein E4H24_01715 [Thermomicrobiales bacterium]|nr:MAG: hypothetical protein E4H24_01715 [Thermomicrobiales bacterium]
MTGRGPQDGQARDSLPIFDRLAPPPPADVVAARIDVHTGPGDIVADLFGRGGWIARSAIDRQRRAVSLESNPMTRMLAEVVLRPPDVRHLDAAFQGMAASPLRESSLKTSIGDLFATRCATCGRALVVDEIGWQVDDDASIAGRMRPIERHYRCAVCRDQLGGSDHRQAALDRDDLRRATADVGADAMRSVLLARFPIPDGAEALPRELLDLHTDRQLVALGAILERIESDLRAAPVMATLRLALLYAILPASRLGSGPGRHAALRVTSGHVRPHTATRVSERNPWLAFEDGFRLVRGFVQGLDSGPYGPIQARLGEDLRSLGEGAATTFIGLAGDEGSAAMQDGPGGYGRTTPTPKIRLALGQSPMRPNLDRLAVAYHATSWLLGAEAASRLPIHALAGPSFRRSWRAEAEIIGDALGRVGPVMARDGRAIQLVDGGSEAVIATVLGGAQAGFRLLGVHTSDHVETKTSVVELLPPGGRLPPGARTRANVSLEALPGGAGDAFIAGSSGLFTPAERFDARPFSASDAARAVTDAAVEMLCARGEPAPHERLLGQILIGLDRAGQLHRLAATMMPADATGSAGDPGPDPVESLVVLIRDELGRPTQERLTEIEPGRWWLLDREDLARTAAPLADRVEWAAFSLLSTAGPMSEATFLERMGAMFNGPDLPEDGLIRACLASYRSQRAGSDQVTTDDDLLERSQEHTELLAAIADGGHRLGMRVWLGSREQTRRFGRGTLGDLLLNGEQRPFLGSIAPAIEDLAEVDGIWYVRAKVAFMFEVEWTAMLGEPLLRRHARIPPNDALIRFLVIAPERTDLVRYKLAQSPLLRAAIESGNWHIMRSDRLRAFLAREPLDLDDLEPYLGLDPEPEDHAEQIRMFEEGPA